MLLEEFDESKKAVINPEFFHKPLEGMPKTCVTFFSKSVMQQVIETFNAEIIADEIENATAKFPVYKINVNGTDIAIFHSAVGAPACVGNAEELISLGVKNILAVGCCGCLSNDIEEYSIIIPTSAIRDEGTSYHYAKAEDETIINPKMVDIIENVMNSHNINYKKGKTWTTDAIFRETSNKVKDRISQGAITVDMECSAMNVLCKFRNVNYGQIFYGADNLAGEEYDPRTIMTIRTKNEDAKQKIISLALECGLAIDKEMN
ncbi:MAG: nucleoside phosphorylase [Clostridia bacterium]|nr:nucleoside phosphorylase [Clostridia bacterium]